LEIVERVQRSAGKSSLRSVLDHGRAADDIRPCAEALFPETVADDANLSRAIDGVIVFVEEASYGRVYSEHLEMVSADEFGLDLLRLVTFGYLPLMAAELRGNQSGFAKAADAIGTHA